MPARRRLPLRIRLSLVAVCLVGAGLLVAGLATRYELQNFLIDRVDKQLSGAGQPVTAYFLRADNDPGAQQQVIGVLSPGSYAAVISADGRIVASQYFGTGSAPHGLNEAARDADIGSSSADGYRLAVLPVGGSPDGGTGSPQNRLVIAMPLDDVNSTLNKLVALELVVGLIVLAVVGGIAFLIVRRELQPLERIEDTAASIAAGDLSQRVPEEAPGTEVGSLAESLNAMLAQIERAFEQRRQSEQRLRRFVADASHELKTPLTSVRGFAELFRRGAAERPDDLALAMRRIESEAERMSVMVDDLLLLANLDQGRPLVREGFDLDAVLAEMVADHALLHAGWPIEYHGAGDGAVVGDELRVRQAVANLLANARSHTPPGTHITVTLAAAGPDRAITVADDGPGIAAEDVPHLFERFFRVDASRARRSGGSGLGLSIVQAIAVAHGGSVSAESAPGAGATFTIVLPAVAAEQPATGVPVGEAEQQRA
jgi:two-component system, OmpR family, sensor kinase